MTFCGWKATEEISSETEANRIGAAHRPECCGFRFSLSVYICACGCVFTCCSKAFNRFTQCVVQKICPATPIHRPHHTIRNVTLRQVDFVC